MHDQSALVHVQFKIRILVIAFYTLSIALLWFVKLHACRSYCYTWYGMLPAQVGYHINIAWPSVSLPFLIRPCSGTQFSIIEAYARQSTWTLCFQVIWLCCTFTVGLCLRLWRQAQPSPGPSLLFPCSIWMRRRLCCRSVLCFLSA